jgi:3-dehydroquinate synthase
LYAPALQEDALLQGLKEFQEHLGGTLTIMLLEKLGKGVEVHEMDSNLIVKALHLLRNWEVSGSIQG